MESHSFIWDVLSRQMTPFLEVSVLDYSYGTQKDSKFGEKMDVEGTGKVRSED